MNDPEGLPAEQDCCCREYEDWWFRRGRYDRGAAANARWFADAAEVRAALEGFGPAGEVLELACGSGLWTRQLLAHAGSVTVIDGCGELVGPAGGRVADARVGYAKANLYQWQPDKSYNACFFAFWLAHVPEERFEVFWQKIRRAVAPGGRVFFVELRHSELVFAADDVLRVEDAETVLRRGSGGSAQPIVRRFCDPDALQLRLSELGWDAQVRATPEFFTYGQLVPAE